MQFTLCAFALVSFAAACTASSDDGGVGERRDLVDVDVKVFTNVASSPAVVGAKVAFVDPDGHGEIAITGDDGIAHGQLVRGGSVTALVPLTPADNPPFLATILDVQDGDELSLGWPAPPATLPPASGTATCSTASVTATYEDVDPARVKAIYLSRTTDGSGDAAIGHADPATATSVIDVTGAGATRASMETSLRGPNDGDQQFIADVIDGCDTQYHVDVAANLLPWVGAPSLDAEHAIINIPVDGIGGGDFLKVDVAYMHGGSAVTWQVLGPHAGDVALPPLPGELADLAPVPGDTLSSAAAMLIDDDAIHGYDQARSIAASLTTGGIGLRSYLRISPERIRGSYRIVTF